jgi:oligoribonuclease
MIDTLKPWVPKMENYYDPERGKMIERPDYWSRPYPRITEDASGHSGRTRTPAVPRKNTTMILLWLDLETTGLDPATDTILEVFVTAADISDPFTPIGPEFHAVIAHDGAGLSPFIQKMHTKNGLLAECATSALTVEQVDGMLADMTPETDDYSARPILAGSSIHFDLGFIRVHMPRFAARLSHRLYDVRSVALFCNSLGMPALPKAEAHRSRDDVFESIGHARSCAAWCKP